MYCGLDLTNNITSVQPGTSWGEGPRWEEMNIAYIEWCDSGFLRPTLSVKTELVDIVTFIDTDGKERLDVS